MGCPRCAFNGDFTNGVCPRCGYGSRNQAIPVSNPRIRTFNLQTTALVSLPERVLMRGDVIHQGRYRLSEQLSLPRNQQNQGFAWLATDLRSSRRPVIIRQIVFPDGVPPNPQEAVQTIANRFMELAQQHPGFPEVIDIFTEQETQYLVLSHPLGESLAALIKQQGGALPEREVAEYGRQVCEILALLANHHPPLVHGAISPETLIISHNKNQVSLLHLPLFTPQMVSNDTGPAAYLAPEQVRGEIYPASDIYSLAATLHYAVTGYDPHERLAFFYPPVRRLNPVVTAQMEAILVQGLRLSVPQRFAHPATIGQAFSNLLASHPQQTSMPITQYSPSLQLSREEIRRRSQRRSLRNFSVAGAVSVGIIVIFLALYLFPSFASKMSTTGTAPATATASAQQTALYQTAYIQELKTEMQAYQNKSIGLSDGRLAFDIYPGRADIDLKKQAATAIQQGDTSSAINLFTKATSADPTDGEAQIYNENLHVLQSNAAYITIALGMSIDSSAVHLIRARSYLEAAFLAQHEINAGNKLPRGLHLRLLIDNSGTDNANVATVAQFIANRVSKAGNPDHIVGVMGWPFSSQTMNARDIIASVHLPIISQAASSVKLSGSSPYFFRVNPPDDLQGSTLGNFAVQQLHAKRVLVLRDPTDPYSVSLANAFSERLKALNAAPIDDPANNFTESTTTVVTYEQTAIADAVNKNVNLIFLAGFDVDAVRLAHALGSIYRVTLNPTLANLKILGGDGVDTNLLLGQGNSAEATIATNFPQDMQRLNFSAFADPGEWTFFKIPQNQQPPFFVDWSSTYSGNIQPGNDAILAYDAVQVIINAATLVPGNITGQAIRDALASIGQGKVPPYQGVSGRILFDDRGNPKDKAVVVLTVGNENGKNAIVLNQVAGTFR